MSRIKTKWQAKRIRTGILMALGKKPLGIMKGKEIWVSEDLDRVIMDYADGLVRNAYFRTRISKGDPEQ